jgi:hypothetical protein
VLPLNLDRLDICTLSYEADTDADYDPDIMQSNPLHAFIFNVKTHAASSSDVPVRSSSKGLVVERVWEKKIILSRYLANSNLLIQGRYRVGKSSLLTEMSRENKRWKYMVHIRETYIEYRLNLFLEYIIQL